MRPARVRDLYPWAGDPFSVRVFLRVNGKIEPVPEGSTFLAPLRDRENRAVGSFEVVVENRPSGLLVLRLTGAQTAALPKESFWTLTETPKWDRTLLIGRMIRGTP